MASILNNTTRIYSLAYAVDEVHRRTLALKVLPGLLTWENCKRSSFNKHVSTERDFEDAIEALSKVGYVKVLVDLGRLSLNVGRNTHLENAEEVEKPKRRERKKKVEENPFGAEE